MALIVQKFGGSSVADAAKIQNVSNIITRTYDAGNDVVVVLSAQGDTTDDLIEKAMEINPDASKREMDVLLSTGEQISIALAAMCIEKMGYPVISLTGWQVGMETSSDYSRARIRKVEGSRIRKELDKHRIVLVAGFQGINRYGDITTLGRGGSDTTAVALAVALKADLCQIYTDVDGVYTADPRIVPNAKKLDAITYDEMLELASLGAQVLHNRSVELAKRYQIELEVLSSFTGNPGTIVKEVVKMEKPSSAAWRRTRRSPALPSSGWRMCRAWPIRCSVSGQGQDQCGRDFAVHRRNNTKDITFTIPEGSKDLCQKILEENQENLRFSSMNISTDVAKVSIVGAGMAENTGIAASCSRRSTTIRSTST